MSTLVRNAEEQRQGRSGARAASPLTSPCLGNMRQGGRQAGRRDRLMQKRGLRALRTSAHTAPSCLASGCPQRPPGSTGRAPVRRCRGDMGAAPSSRACSGCAAESLALSWAAFCCSAAATCCAAVPMSAGWR